MSPSADHETDFLALFGRDAEVEASAPGRVNLIGEHTDYNGGFVLPTVIPQRTHVELARREGRAIQVWSDAVPGAGVVAYTLGQERRAGDWADYVRGVTWVLQDAGFAIGGADLRITSTVPLGSGLSSSAAIEMSVLKALREAFALDIGPLEMARAGRRAENEFVGVPTGVMDQMASLLARDGTALFIDTRTLDYRTVPLPPGLELLVVNSGVRHNLAKGDYRTRRRECEEAARMLGVPELRDVTADELERVNALGEPHRRRARHVVTENARVLAAVAAMEAADGAELGRLFDRSHASMRDDYDVSVPEVDLLVALARQQPAVVGARLTGGGFGGSIVALVETGRAAAVGSLVASAYRDATGLTASVLVPAPEAAGESVRRQ